MTTSYAPTDMSHTRPIRSKGVAGQFSLSTEVTYTWADGTTSTTPLQFVSNAYGGPIVMIMSGGHQTFVSRETCDRIGQMLTPEWVDRFLTFTPGA